RSAPACLGGYDKLCGTDYVHEMTVTIDERHWNAVRAALKSTGDRFADLVASAPDPSVKVTADWSLAEMAAHVTGIAWIYTSMAESDGLPSPFAGLDAEVNATTVDTVADLNEVMLRRFSARASSELARQLVDHVDQLLALSHNKDPATPVNWLGGAVVPLAGLLAHLLNELLIHGRDIALAVRSPWRIPPGDAALFLELFLVGVTRSGYGKLLDSDQPSTNRRIAVQFRSKHLTPFTMVLDQGRVSIAEPGRDDVKLRFDPATLNLMLFGRVSKLRAALTGKVIVTGHRPWLLRPFLKKVHLPN
ncbi:MAG: DinB family protein, partial [Micromonosporaceae bacterium]